jgi:hypothetical protein
MQWVLDIAKGILRGMGKKELAEWVDNAPQATGELIGRILIAGIKSDGRITDEAIQALEEVKADHPAPQATAKASSLLEEYVADLSSLVLLAEPHDLIAVRGFLHDKECVILIRIRRPINLGRNDLDVLNDEKSVLLAGSGIEIGMLERSVSDDELRDLNKTIERGRPSEIEDLMGQIDADVVKITKNDVYFEKRPGPRPADRIAAVAAMAKHRASKDFSRPISDGVVGMNEAFRTLSIAKGAQAEALHGYRDGRQNR